METEAAVRIFLKKTENIRKKTSALLFFDKVAGEKFRRFLDYLFSEHLPTAAFRNWNILHQYSNNFFLPTPRQHAAERLFPLSGIFPRSGMTMNELQPLLFLSYESSMFVKENPDRKRNIQNVLPDRLMNYTIFTLHKKWSFPIRISSVNVTLTE